MKMDQNCVDDGLVSPSLDTLPLEVFLHICTFLDGKEIVETLKEVCQSFNDILSDDAVWRAWLKHRWPALPSSNLCFKDDIIPSQTVCLDVDRGIKLWSKGEPSLKKTVNDEAHISTVDTVKLLQDGRIGISGSRDRSLVVWSTADGLSRLSRKEGAHEGWIWGLTACPSDMSGNFLSCSWDSSVKLWTLEQDLTEVAVFKCKAAALSLVCRPGLVAAGLFNSRVELFDARAPDPVGGYHCHNRSILALCLVRDYIVAASEDHTLSVWDITAGKTFKSGILVSKEGYPRTLSFSDGNLLFVGDTDSLLHLVDTAGDSFHILESHKLGHQQHGTITTMWHNLGFVVTGSKDSTVRVHTATRPPHLLTQLASGHGGVTGVDFSDPSLFVGCVNNAVALWTPC